VSGDEQQFQSAGLIALIVLFFLLSTRFDVMWPGRENSLMHLLREIDTFNLRNVEYLVFDEADRLFEMGFAEQLNEIMREMPEQRQTLLFSATMPKLLIQVHSTKCRPWTDQILTPRLTSPSSSRAPASRIRN
jgi:superfamily II DNA/RNA helicase